MKIEKITPQIAALYLGQKCTYDSKALNQPIETEINARVISDMEDGFATITPHLRRLESMTEEEAREVYEIEHEKSWVTEFGDCSCLAMYIVGKFTITGQKTVFDRLIGSPAVWLHLLSKGFDLLGLIDSGLAKEVG